MAKVHTVGTIQQLRLSEIGRLEAKADEILDEINKLFVEKMVGRGLQQIEYDLPEEISPGTRAYSKIVDELRSAKWNVEHFTGRNYEDNRLIITLPKGHQIAH